MDASVIDTLRYASRLRAAGVEPQQAEAMSRALNDEIGGGVATKGDLEHAADGLTGEISRVERELKGEISRVEDELKGEISRVEDELKGDIASVESGLARVENELKEDIGQLKEDIGQVEGRLARLEGDLKTSVASVNGRIDNLDTKVEGLGAKFDTQGRYVFLVLALIAAFGLYNIMFPPLATRLAQTADAQAVSAPAPAQAPGPMEQQPSAQP